MARRKREPMSEGKRNIIGMLLEEYDIKTAEDIQDALNFIRIICIGILTFYGIQSIL